MTYQELMVVLSGNLGAKWSASIVHSTLPTNLCLILRGAWRSNREADKVSLVTAAPAKKEERRDLKTKPDEEPTGA